MRRPSFCGTTDELTRAIVSRDRTSGEATYVELVLASPDALTLSEVEELLGPFDTPPRVSWNQPIQAVFSRDPDPTNPFSCSISVHIEPDGEDLHQGTALSVSLRRDIRL